jgi:hypothetical protein
MRGIFDYLLVYRFFIEIASENQTEKGRAAVKKRKIKAKSGEMGC